MSKKIFRLRKVRLEGTKLVMRNKHIFPNCNNSGINTPQKHGNQLYLKSRQLIHTNIQVSRQID